jgi:hypothetical protein
MFYDALTEAQTNPDPFPKAALENFGY